MNKKEFYEYRGYCGSLRKAIKFDEDFIRGINCETEFFINFKVT